MVDFGGLGQAWASGDAGEILALVAPDAVWIVDGREYHGHPQIKAYVAATLAGPTQVRTVLRRAFNDLDEPTWSAAEWAFRKQLGDTCSEVEQALLMHVDANGQIARLRIHNDELRRCASTMDAPLRPELRKAHYPQPITPMSKADILALQDRHVMQGWRLGNADMICSCHADDSVILNAWEEIQGYDQFRISVAKYTQNFADTAIEVHRVVYDGQNIALNQTWTCTNRLSGKRAGDQDLILGVMQDGHIHYWREYFDGSQSAQTLEQTHFGVLKSAPS